MKIKLHKKYGDWHSSVYRGNGGMNSLIVARQGKSLWYCLGVFKVKNLIRAFKK